MALLEDKPSRIFLDIESENAVDLSKIIDQLKAAVQQQFQIEPNIQTLREASIGSVNRLWTNDDKGTFGRRTWL